MSISFRTTTNKKQQRTIAPCCTLPSQMQLWSMGHRQFSKISIGIDSDLENTRKKSHRETSLRLEMRHIKLAVICMMKRSSNSELALPASSTVAIRIVWVLVGVSLRYDIFSQKFVHWFLFHNKTRLSPKRHRSRWGWLNKMNDAFGNFKAFHSIFQYFNRFLAIFTYLFV